MLAQLHIQNFALIDRMNLNFYEGFNVLTGETGAGKSIVIDSVNFILGDKQTKEIIRTGENAAYVEAVFCLHNHDGINELLRSVGIETDDNVIISREIGINGRSTTRVNGRAVTVQFLKQFRSFLVDIHGQHEHQSLMDEGNHIKILDSFCDDRFRKIMEEFAVDYERLKEIKAALNKLQTDEQQRLRKIDLYRFQLSEIEDAKLQEGEEDQLKTRRDVLIHSEKIIQSLHVVYQNIYESEDQVSAYDAIGSGITALESISKYDDQLMELNEEMNDIYYRLEALIQNIRNYMSGIEYEEDELTELTNRLDGILRIKRKYGASLEDVFQYRDKIKLELDNIEMSDEMITSLNEEKTQLDKNTKLLCEKMTSLRKETADNLEKAIEKELQYLGMLKTDFKILVEPIPQMNENGMDNICFYISTNPGEPAKPLARIASGGEMSRIMLAIKTVIAEVDQIPTLIFDEIDTGISGRTAQAVAEKMANISRKHQLFCVTHLPQIAAMADAHFKIEKSTSMDKTKTTVTRLDEAQKIEELARLLGGAAVTELTMEHAREMLKLAGELKKANE